MFILLRCGLWLAGLSCLSAAPATPSLTSVNKAMMYLSHFGYLSPAVSDPHSAQIVSEDLFTNAVQEFQSFAHINVTGVVDQETEQLMSRPRCGIQDKMEFASYASSRLQDTWSVRDLTYKISKYSSLLDKAATDKAVQDALGLWSSVTPLTFSRKDSGPVNIEISFEQGDHAASCESFDGPDGILAHAFYPPKGTAHFDGSEKWTVSSDGINLYQVAAHEFGHSLGLKGHSDVGSALMSPFYKGYELNFKLHDDDIKRIQSLYGAKETAQRKSSAEEPPKEEDEDFSTTIASFFKKVEDVISEVGGITTKTKQYLLFVLDVLDRYLNKA